MECMAISYIQSIGLRQPFCLEKKIPNFDMFIFTSWRSTVQKKSHKNTFLYLLYLKQLQMYENPNPWIGDDWTQIKFGLGLEKSLSKTSVYTKTFQNITRVRVMERDWLRNSFFPYNNKKWPHFTPLHYVCMIVSFCGRIQILFDGCFQTIGF